MGALASRAGPEAMREREGRRGDPARHFSLPAENRTDTGSCPVLAELTPVLALAGGKQN
jgi:hypothetical protein